MRKFKKDLTLETQFVKISKNLKKKGHFIGNVAIPIEFRDRKKI